MNVRKSNWFTRYGVGTALVILVGVLTAQAVRRWHRPGQLDVLTAQAMDMSAMRPPTGASPVELAMVRRGNSIGDVVTYTGTVQAFNTQDVSPRIVGQLVSLPVYSGDSVRAGQVVARLDSAEISAKTDQANAEAGAAEVNQRFAQLNHHLHHQAALDQAAAQIAVADAGVSDAQAETRAAEEAVADARAAIESAKASDDYWKTEIAREKSLTDAGAASRQEYQSELSQAQGADAALAQAQAKRLQAEAMVAANRAKSRAAQNQVQAAGAMQRMAQADLALAQEQEKQADLGAVGSAAAARQAAIVQGYAQITSPFDGVVTERSVSPGTLVQPGTVLLKVAQIDSVRVQANVAVADLVGISRGSAVEIIPQTSGSVNSATVPIHAKVTSIFPAASEMSRTAVVEAVIPNPRHALLPGAFVTIHLSKSHGPQEQLLVPASALIYDGGKPFVFVAHGSKGSEASVTAAAPLQYECAICHMRYSAADARKHNFIDPMDGGKLTPVASAVVRATASGTSDSATVHRVQVALGASDGTSTEISSPQILAGDQVVTRGQAGLTEGALVISTSWGDGGPETLPSEATAMNGVTRYRCEKCGMTYSADDAKKNNFIDPMDGGKLSPVMGGKL